MVYIGVISYNPLILTFYQPPGDIQVGGFGRQVPVSEKVLH